MKLTQNGIEKIERILLTSFLILSSLTFFMVILKSMVSPIFGVYKEFFCILIILFSLIFNKLSVPVVLMKAIFVFLSCALLSILFSSVINPLPIFNYIYEMKITLFYFILLLMLLCITRNEENTEKSLTVFIKVLFVFSLLNIMLSIFQRVFFSDIIGSFGFGSSTDARDSFGSDNNIVIQTQGGKFRTIGTFSAPMVLAEYLLFAGLFFALKFRLFISKALWFALCCLGVYYTSYKTALMYMPAIAMMAFLPYRYVRVSVLLYALLLLAFGFISTHTYIIYDIVNPIHPMYAEYSIRLRIQFVYDVFQQMESIWQYIFGAGYGYNGGFLGYFDNSVPLDSIYLWILSNYGLLGVIIFIVSLLVFFIFDSFKRFDELDSDFKMLYFIKMYIFLVIVANFFWNNVIINFPSLFFPIVAYVLYYRKCYFKEIKL